MSPIDATNLGIQTSVSHYCYLWQFTDEQLKPVWDEVNKIRNNFELATEVNDTLAGQILREYALDDSRDHVTQLVLPLAQQYEMMTHHAGTTELKMQNLWVNFQKKHEFNPVHTHSGVYSFVIWLDIPFTNEEERLASPGAKSNSSVAGNFYFMNLNQNSPGGLATTPLPVDKSWNNRIAIFPAYMNHGVHPFYTSDEYRVTIAGNLEL